jgi:RimJ/RimL family protein N-acetyltransferase
MTRSLQRALDIPVLETERLRLRGHTVDDFKNCAALWGDANVTRYIGGKPHTEEESWSRLLRYAGHWLFLSFGYWVVEERETGDFIGEVGLSDYKRAIEPPLGDIPEVGWVLASGKHGKGYATEAVRTVLRWGHQRFESKEMACLIHPDNLASIRVAKKCGFRERFHTMYRDSPTIIFGWEESGQFEAILGGAIR